MVFSFEMNTFPIALRYFQVSFKHFGFKIVGKHTIYAAANRTCFLRGEYPQAILKTSTVYCKGYHISNNNIAFSSNISNRSMLLYKYRA